MFLVLLLLSLGSFANGVKAKYRINITHIYHLEGTNCYLFEVDIISDNGTPENYTDDYVIDVGYVKSCLKKGISPSIGNNEIIPLKETKLDNFELDNNMDLKNAIEIKSIDDVKKK